MTDEALIEELARAIYEADDPWHKAWPWPNCSQAGHADAMRHIARAILPIIRAREIEAGEKVRLACAKSVGDYNACDNGCSVDYIDVAASIGGEHD